MKKLLLALILLYSGTVTAAPTEVWECKDKLDTSGWENILVRAKMYAGFNKGIINIFGVKQITDFDIIGINRRWDFGLSKIHNKGMVKIKSDSDSQNGLNNLAFIIKPDGDAQYYDFSKSVTADPSLYLTCRRSQ